MELIVFLLLFPLVTASAMLLFRKDAPRDALVRFSAIAVLIASVFLFTVNIRETVAYYHFNGEAFTKLMFVAEIFLGLFIFYIGARSKRYFAAALAVIQLFLAFYLEFAGEELNPAGNYLYVDKLSIIMTLIIGIIGSLICIYALGYMKDFHHHYPEIKDRRPLFFFILFVFLSAMFGIVLSDNLQWIFFFWEITTLCSFILIGYTGTKEAEDNAFRALIMNLLGGMAFSSGIIYLVVSGQSLELSTVFLTRHTAVALIPAVLIAFAGITKSAQLPFSTWLLGAMVAPTPTSALLHSSTMVKAGVYIIIRLAPILQGTTAGFIVALIGGITFFLTSCIAVSQSNAKKLLAYSTIANLGLIVACAGIGTHESIWAATLLVIFHAVAKSLLFLCVGTIEHTIGSRDIEDMDGLIQMMPKMAIMLAIGIAGMFLAPFGMLISKWAALRAFIDANPVVVMLLAFGSAPTLFFWTKWLGKVMSMVEGKESIEKQVNAAEWGPLYVLSFMTVLICALFPVISTFLVEPYLIATYGIAVKMSAGNIIIMLIMLGLIVLMPLRMILSKENLRYVQPYLGGANMGSSLYFRGSMGQGQELGIRNYYMDKYLNEKKLQKIGVILSIALLIMLLEVVLI